MNNKVSVLALVLTACSMQALPSPPAATRFAIPPYSKLYAALQPKDSKGLPTARVCNLGGDCLAMDSHPFEVCLVSAKSCGDKLAEVLQVEKPKGVSAPPPLQKTSR